MGSGSRRCIDTHSPHVTNSLRVPWVGVKGPSRLGVTHSLLRGSILWSGNDEGHHLGWWGWNPFGSPDASDLETVAPYIRQTHGVLPHVGLDVGGDSRGPHHLDSARSAPLRAVVR